MNINNNTTPTIIVNSSKEEPVVSHTTTNEPIEAIDLKVPTPASAVTYTAQAPNTSEPTATFCLAITPTIIAECTPVPDDSTPLIKMKKPRPGIQDNSDKESMSLTLQLEAIWSALGLVDSPNDAISGKNEYRDLSPEYLYNNLDKLLSSNNEFVHQFAKLFKDEIEKHKLNDNEALAFIRKVFENINGLVQIKLNNNISLSYNKMLRIDSDKNGEFLDNLAKFINEESIKIKPVTGDENDLDYSKLVLADKLYENPDKMNQLTNSMALIVGLNGSSLYDSLDEMLLSSDAAVRKFANLLCDTYDKLLFYTDEEKIRFNSKLIEMIVDKTNTQTTVKKLSEESLENLDFNNNNNIFDEIIDIINSEELQLRYESLVNDFYDIESMYEWLNNEFQMDVKTNGLTYEQLFKLATDETWNEKNNNFFANIWCLVDEIDINQDKIISYDEMKKLIGEGIQGNDYQYPRNNDLDGDGKVTKEEFFAYKKIPNFKNNIEQISKIAEEKYEALSLEEKLQMVIEEAKRYCQMMGMSEYLEILNGHSGHWEIVIGGQSKDAAATCDKFNHVIHMGVDCLNNGFESAVGTLLHEVTHAVYSELIDSIEQENYCDMVKENYLDSVGKGEYVSNEEYEQIDKQNSNSPLYKHLPRDNNFLLNVIGKACEWVADVWNWIKGWF